MAFCANCGAQLPESGACTNCGISPVETPQQNTPPQDYQQPQGYPQPPVYQQPPAYPQQGYPPPDYQQQPQGYQQQGYPPPDYQQQPQGYQQQGYPPPDYQQQPQGYQQQGYQQQGYYQQGYSQPQSYAPPPGGGGENSIIRSPVTCIILSIITCGIYYLYWLWVTNKQINDLIGAEIVSAGMLILGWFCFPVLWYNWYKWDNTMQDIAQRYNIRYSANFVLWIILSVITGVGSFVMMFQIQDALNKAYGG